MADAAHKIGRQLKAAVWLFGNLLGMTESCVIRTHHRGCNAIAPGARLRVGARHIAECAARALSRSLEEL
jgi:hypothetical protein